MWQIFFIGGGMIIQTQTLPSSVPNVMKLDTSTVLFMGVPKLPHGTQKELKNVLNELHTIFTRQRVICDFRDILIRSLPIV